MESFTGLDPSTELESSIITAGTSRPNYSSLDTTAHSNFNQLKRKADFLGTSHVNIVSILWYKKNVTRASVYYMYEYHLS